MNRGKGWIPSTTDVSAGPVHTLLGAHRVLGAPSLSCDRRGLITIKDQSITSSCVGFADAQAITARRRFLRQKRIDAGLPDPGQPEFVSPFSIYTAARALERKQSGLPVGTPLIDQGSQPSLALEAMGLWGVCSEKDWAFDEGKVNDEPDPLELRTMSKDIIVKLYKISTTDPVERERLLAIAIDQGHLPVFGTEVDKVFEDYSGGILGRRRGKSEGGHMLGACGHYPDPSDPTAKIFWIWNHWTKSWGLNGFAQVDRDFIGSPDLGDIAVIHLEE